MKAMTKLIPIICLFVIIGGSLFLFLFTREEKGDCYCTSVGGSFVTGWRKSC